MKRFPPIVLVLAAGFGGATPAAEVGVIDKVDVDLRYRAESVAQDGFDEDALASTLRGRFGMRSTDWHGLRAYVGFEAVEAVGDDRYDSTANGRGEYPVVADPEDAEVDQAWLGWAGGPVELKAGRQRINLDNQRFIGAVGFRQNEQTFDAVTASWQSAAGTLRVGYLHNANRVFGEHHPVAARADSDLDGHLLNFSAKAGPVSASAYAYALEFQDAPAASHRDLGLRITGEPALGGDWRLPFTAEYALQEAHADAPDTVDADYLLAELGVGAGALVVRLGYEQLGGDGTYGFATPLATLHAFNGWADRFLVTPANGLRDRYGQLAYTFGRFDGVMAYHDFVSDTAALEYGTEWNAALGARLPGNASARVEYARYDAQDFASDVRIVWVTLQGTL